MAEETLLTSASPWPQSLGAGNTEVLVNGQPAPLYFVSATQINGQLPYEVGPGTARVQVKNNGVTSATVQFPVVPAAPGVLQFGTNRAVAVNADGQVNTGATPAPQQSIVIVYFTGLGVPDNAVATGSPASDDPLSRPRLPARVTVGGQEAEVLFLGLAPGFVGLGQANIKLPPLPPGDHAVVITIGDGESNGTMITVAALQPAASGPQ